MKAHGKPPRGVRVREEGGHRVRAEWVREVGGRPQRKSCNYYWVICSSAVHYLPSEVFTQMKRNSGKCSEGGRLWKRFPKVYGFLINALLLFLPFPPHSSHISILSQVPIVLGLFLFSQGFKCSNVSTHSFVFWRAEDEWTCHSACHIWTNVRRYSSGQGICFKG